MKTQVKSSDTKKEQRNSTPGKHRFAIQVDGDNREYYVHIHQTYEGSSRFPVVLMLHGSGGNGEKFYKISGWVQQGEDANIITVFPSAWKYDCVEDDGMQKHNAEKWTGYDLELCDNVIRRDDVKFLGKVIEAVASRYNTETERVYMVGFSNGGEMAARCAIELSDKLSAVVACAGSIPPDTTFTPLRRLPVLLQIGAADAKLMAKLGATSPLSLNFPKVLATYPQVQSILNSYIDSFGLNPNYTATGDPGKYIVAKYSNNSGPRNDFGFAIVKDLEHEYPNGRNHPMHGAKVHWEWMKDFDL
ncbi:polyhydroxybutyrate depolymerase [Pricia antarctica]|uniref:Polyhydroxybutyrate depolymerase n=1 Tax=Pricia antarctica TaxID=641691 RepID=A0A1G7BAR8_9FLAO|nr:PHB depolymerase family esterase [Pricia antarctica]SDE24062.1 polyhydroxybutyrate depolymerase [Pricia antarctica]